MGGANRAKVCILRRAAHVRTPAPSPAGPCGRRRPTAHPGQSSAGRGTEAAPCPSATCTRLLPPARGPDAGRLWEGPLSCRVAVRSGGVRLPESGWRGSTEGPCARVAPPTHSSRSSSCRAATVPCSGSHFLWEGRGDVGWACESFLLTTHRCRWPVTPRQWGPGCAPGSPPSLTVVQSQGAVGRVQAGTVL